MIPYFEDKFLTLYGGDCREVLAQLPAESVHTAVTSPPYWGLRDYGVGGQLGLEPTPEAYVENMVAVFREVRRVLRADGTLWLNLGDSYAAGGVIDPYRTTSSGKKMPPQGRAPLVSGLKPKDLVGIPWRVAFALQADGWYLRSDVIWSKPNPMPESVTDRPTKAHEYLFLFAKGKWVSRVVQVADLAGERVHLRNDGRKKDANVWADEFAVRLASAILDRTEADEKLGLSALDPQVRHERDADIDRATVADLPARQRAAALASRLLGPEGTAKEFLGELQRLGIGLRDRDKLLVGGGALVLPLPPGVDRYGERSIAIHDAGEIGEFDVTHGTIIASRTTTCSYYYDADAVREDGAGRTDVGRMTSPARLNQGGPWTATEKPEAGRNLRSVWTIATEPYPGAHFATFPRKLVEPCVKAGCPEGGTVLDPFAGSGTTLLVAQALGRKAIGIDLNPKYLEMAVRRGSREFGRGKVTEIDPKAPDEGLWSL